MSKLLAGMVTLPIVWNIVDKFPRLLHNVENKTLSSSIKAVRTIGHRGSTREGIPENSMAAFRHAVANKIDCIELDVRRTLDNQIVIFHDPNLTRMTNGSVQKSIEEMNFADLPLLTPSEEVQKTSGDTTEYAIPLFEEVLGLIDENPKLCMIVEFKENDDQLIEEVHRRITAKERKNRIIWFSLKTDIVTKLRAYDPSLPTIVGALEALQFILYYYIGILPFMTMPFAVFGITLQELPLSKLRSEKALAPVPDVIKRALAWLLDGTPPWFLTSPALFRHLQERGYPIWFLGCNEECHIEAGEKFGANGVLTDRPEWLRTSYTDAHRLGLQRYEQKYQHEMSDGTGKDN